MSSDRARLELSPVKVGSGALAAASAAAAASTFGVYGTIIGAAVMSVIASVGTAVYDHAARRTAHGVRVGGTKLRRSASSDSTPDDATLVQTPGDATVVQTLDDDATVVQTPDDATLVHEVAHPEVPAEPEPVSDSTPAGRLQWLTSRWPALAVGSVLVFAAGLGVLTMGEAVLRSPASGSDEGGATTTIGKLVSSNSDAGSAGTGEDGGAGGAGGSSGGVGTTQHPQADQDAQQKQPAAESTGTPEQSSTPTPSEQSASPAPEETGTPAPVPTGEPESPDEPVPTPSEEPAPQDEGGSAAQ